MKNRPRKNRISVTMTQPYVTALDGLVEKGLYLGRGDAILESLRQFFKQQGIKPFSD
ncbi:unnamed protein product [marine sediment metagenome]|uniref:Ribbon-helix-helix protein CopG domain-containing protein n=1 Tax=marine sediment metagenome TaxID=412755 RepID=X1QA52_9ZZZZ